MKLVIKSIVASLIPLLLTVLGCYLAFKNLWWFVIVFTIVAQNGWYYFRSVGITLKNVLVDSDVWNMFQTLTSLICTIFMIVFMFIVVSPWWGILIMVIVNVLLPFLLPQVATIISMICVIPMFLFGK